MHRSLGQMLKSHKCMHMKGRSSRWGAEKAPTSELAGARHADAEATVAAAAALIQAGLCCLASGRALCQQLPCFLSPLHLHIIINRSCQLAGLGWRVICKLQSIAQFEISKLLTSLSCLQGLHNPNQQGQGCKDDLTLQICRLPCHQGRQHANDVRSALLSMGFQ